MIPEKENAAGANQTAVKNAYNTNLINRNLKNQLHSFAEINALALSVLPALLNRWLPDGVLRGREYTARNPKRADRRAGSFKINIRTGRWADFATGDKGGDVVSLASYLFGLKQSEAKQRISEMLGVRHG
jgi:hypothetical protein